MNNKIKYLTIFSALIILFSLYVMYFHVELSIWTDTQWNLNCGGYNPPLVCDFTRYVRCDSIMQGGLGIEWSSNPYIQTYSSYDIFVVVDDKWIDAYLMDNTIRWVYMPIACYDLPSNTCQLDAHLNQDPNAPCFNPNKYVTYWGQLRIQTPSTTTTSTTTTTILSPTCEQLGKYDQPQQGMSCTSVLVQNMVCYDCMPISTTTTTPTTTTTTECPPLEGTFYCTDMTICPVTADANGCLHWDCDACGNGSIIDLIIEIMVSSFNSIMSFFNSILQAIL